MVTLKGYTANMLGVSTDQKPTDADINTIFRELNTNKYFYFDGTTWNEIPSSGGGGGFVPTEDQLAAMNSGITSEDVTQIGTNETNISTIQTTVASFHKGIGTNIYFSETEPTGTITYGSYWISTTATKVYGVDVYGATVEQGSFASNTGAEYESSTRIRTTFDNAVTAGTYTLSATGVDNVVMYAYTSNSTSTFSSADSVTDWQQLPYTFTTTRDLYLRFAFRKANNAEITPSVISNVSLIAEKWV